MLLRILSGSLPALGYGFPSRTTWVKLKRLRSNAGLVDAFNFESIFVPPTVSVMLLKKAARLYCNTVPHTSGSPKNTYCDSSEIRYEIGSSFFQSTSAQAMCLPGDDKTINPLPWTCSSRTQRRCPTKKELHFYYANLQITHHSKTETHSNTPYSTFHHFFFQLTKKLAVKRSL